MAINPINVSNQNLSVIQNEDAFFGRSQDSDGPKELPFANYMKQALFGINEAAVDAAKGYTELAIGKPGVNLHDVTTTDFEANFMLHVAAVAASQLTKGATTLFQMQF